MSPAQGARRNALANTHDARAVETRQRLANAFQQAVDQGRADITVTEICHLAHVGRSTFYTHFATMEDLAVAAVAELCLVPPSVAAPPGPTDSSPARHDRIRRDMGDSLRRMQRHHALMAYVLTSDAGPTVRAQVTEQIATLLLPTVALDWPDSTLPEINSYAHYIAGGIATVTLGWILEQDVSVDAVIDRCLNLFPQWLVSGSPQPSEPA